MLKELVRDIAEQSGVSPTNIELVNGLRLGCKDAHLLKISVMDKMVTALIHQEELETFRDDGINERTCLKIQSAIHRLKEMLDA